MDELFTVNYKDGYANFKRMFKDPSSTKHILALAKAVNGPSLKHSFNRLLHSEKGMAVVMARPEISDLYPLFKCFDNDSVAANVIKNQTYPLEMLVRLSKLGTRNKAYIDSTHSYSWMARRYRDTHDIWHTLAGYQMDFFGEICLAAFSYAQTKAYQWLLVMIMGLYKLKFSPLKLLAVYEAYKRGKKCNWLLEEDYTILLKENLEECRLRLNLSAPKVYDRLTKN